MKHRSTWDPTRAIKEGTRTFVLNAPCLLQKMSTFISDGYLPNVATRDMQHPPRTECCSKGGS